MNRIAQDDFRISPVLYYTATSLIAIGVAAALIGDITIGKAISIVMDIAVASAVAVSLILVLGKKVNLNIGLGIVLYASAINFLVEATQAIFDGRENPAQDVVFNLLTVTVLMGITGFILSKVVSLVIGVLISTVAIMATIVLKETSFDWNLPFLLIVILGFAFSLVYYRLSLEKILDNLHDTNNEVTEQRDTLARLKGEAEQALTELQRAQKRIITQEKLASLGALTAGIAHEIKNPLNFITNFADSSIEMMDELLSHIEKTKPLLKGDKNGDIDYLVGELRHNMVDIKEHGKRGDHIVKSMLMHSRSGASTFTTEDLNLLTEECLNLSYHGTRAQNVQFQAGRDFQGDQDLSSVDIVRGDMSRVLLNMCNNAFYSVNEKRKIAGSDYKPRVTVRLKRDGQFAQIRIEDNGIGIQPEIKEKMFMPFFTTKPTGEGTGLGLSMSHEIIVQEHGGSIEIESEPGEFARFIITIPLKLASHGGVA